ncbi:S53 family peptidase [Paludibacterium purpuratum]|uniref:Pseudomonalisin/xanthomonalisin n=1 Tax=Paludibacterium purpuratum TaxID=1144873 RepID=A0A4R7AZ77_9NEIS|nr:S53 family peptidase [Paludibacterium purpuratum]TDR71995.1 pseudomonalisin/xanthomonalisin [Paludibacterium purpuratum]
MVNNQTKKIYSVTLGAFFLGNLAWAQAGPTWVDTQTKSIRPPVTTMAALPAQPGTPMHVVVALKLRNRAQLDQQVARMRADPLHAQHLSKEAFLRQYAPLSSQVNQVVRYLQKQGFRNIRVADNRLLIQADGTALTAGNAFNTSIRLYSQGEHARFGNTRPAQVPAALGGTVLSIMGLQNVYKAHFMARPVAAGTLAATPKGVSGHEPFTFSAIYNGTKAPNASKATIGIIAQGDLTQTLADLQTFQQKHKLNVPVDVVQTGDASSDTSGLVEWNMDSQSSLGAAGGVAKQMLFYVAPTLENNALTVAFNQAVSDNQAQAINVSLGECENDAKNDGSADAQDQIFQTAVAQGQTFAVSSGDSGSDECGNGGTSQSYPAVSPYVVAVGGTTVTTSSNGSYLSESTWSGGGGGPSDTESAPDWQAQSGVLGSSTQRGAPDIAFDGDPASGALVLVNGAQQQVGGTSLSAPIFTGIWARMQSIRNNQAGFAGPTIYRLAKSKPKTFHDVTTGNNGSFSAKKGWDYATGWGSIDIYALSQAIQQGL